MVIVCIGDSLTAGDYGVFGKRGIANVQKENYPYYLSRLTGAEVRNFGRCGYKSGAYLKYYTEGKVNLSGADAVIIMLGTNGGQSDTEDTPDNISYNKLIDLCIQDAPKAKVFLCTPPHATEDPEFSNCGYAEQVERAVRFVRKTADERRLPLIDVAKCPCFTAENESVMQPNDGLHFGKEGYMELAKFIAEGLSTHIV